jgi:hypothetical protein
MMTADIYEPICRICKKRGVICDDLAITGSRHVVHFGDCHDKLVEMEKGLRKKWEANR